MQESLMLNMTLVMAFLLVAMAFEPRIATRMRASLLRGMLVVLRLPFLLPRRQQDSHKLVEAEKAFNRGEVAEARKTCDQLISHADYSGDWLLHGVLGLFHLLTGHQITIPKSSRITGLAHHLRARIHLRANDHEKARKDLDKAIAFSDGHGRSLAEANLLYAASYSLQQKWKEAEQRCDAGLAAQSNNATLHRLRAEARLIQGRDDEALEDLNQSIKIDPAQSVSHKTRALVHQRKRNFAAALADCDAALAINAKDDSLYFLKAETLFHLKDNEECLKNLDQAIELNPKLSGAFSSRGAIHGRLGNWEACIDDCNTAISLDPKSSTAYNNRAWAYAHLGQPELGLADVEEAIRLGPERATVLGTRGAVYVGLGRFAEALADLNKAIADDQSDGENYFNRAVAHENLGDSELAKQDYAKADELGFKRPVASDPAVELHSAPS
ncbi:MAG TPA: tetratricopeptide repeat protein [Candidatus Obscuribacterales bacterium]